MSSASKRSLLDCPEWPRALSGVELGNDERLLWAGRPVLAGYGKQLLWAYPLCVPFGVGALIGGWCLYRWAVGAGANSNRPAAGHTLPRSPTGACLTSPDIHAFAGAAS